jgi:hypothetical protein
MSESKDLPKKDADRRWHLSGWSKRHPITLALWIAVIPGLIVPGIIGLVHLIAGSGGGDTAITTAERVAACVNEHQMTSAEEGPVKPSAKTVAPFASANGGLFNSVDPIYGKGNIPVSLYESCSWPPPDGSDPTGYSQVLVSTVPGAAKWPGEVNPYTYADVFDSSCKNLIVFYSGGHTLTSFSDTVHVAAGSLKIIDPQMNRGPAPGPGGKEPASFSSWAETVGYYFVPGIGESAVLHQADLSILKVTCKP